MTKSDRIAVIGGGSWATAIVKILENNCKHIHWWIRELEIIENIQKYHHNPHFLSIVELPVSKLILSNDMNEIIKKSDILIFCIPAAFLEDALKNIDKNILKNKIIVSAIKGIVPSHSLSVTQYFKEYFNIKDEQIALISGPSHAEEVSAEKLTYLTIASTNDEVIQRLQPKITCRFIKTTTSNDVLGIEFSTVLKNIMSLAAGICIGLDYGDNFIAVLVANGIKEIKQFIKTVHPIERNICESAYTGDLLVTAYSKFSRNRVFGNMLGRGYSVNSAKLEMNMIAEGYYAVKGIKEINKKYNVSMPITDAVYNILYENIAPVIEIKILSEKLS